MTRTRPGTALTDDERFAALLTAAIGALEEIQATLPDRRVEDALGVLRYVRVGLEKRGGAQ